VLLRADLNVPLDKRTGEITDDGTHQRDLPTSAVRSTRRLE
jgi:3-phosphoglycerate kinase